MFFTNLQNKIGAQVTAVTATITFHNGSMSVIVNPTVDPDVLKKNPALGTQFSVTGTAEELDTGFAGVFGQFTLARASLAEQAASATKALAAATSELKKPAGKQAPAPAAKPTDGLSLSGETVPTVSVPPEGISATDLFDLED